MSCSRQLPFLICCTLAPTDNRDSYIVTGQPKNVCRSLILNFIIVGGVCFIQNLTRPKIISKNASKSLQNPSCQGFSVSAMSQASQEKVWEGHDVSRKSKSFTLILLQSSLFQTLSPSHSDRQCNSQLSPLSLYGASQISNATSSLMLLLFTCLV